MSKLVWAVEDNLCIPKYLTVNSTGRHFVCVSISEVKADSTPAFESVLNSDKKRLELLAEVTRFELFYFESIQPLWRTYGLACLQGKCVCKLSTHSATLFGIHTFLVLWFLLTTNMEIT